MRRNGEDIVRQVGIQMENAGTLFAVRKIISKYS
jgi:hypothetical protein